MNVIKIFALGVISVCGLFYTCAQEANCFHKESSKPGKCTKINSCILKNGEHPQNCGFEGSIPLVCCTDIVPLPEENLTVGRKSMDKCVEYGAAVKNITDFCRITGSYQLIINDNGLPATLKEFPHMVAIGYQTENGSIVYSCGGSLISNDFILTSAHCYNSRELNKPVTVRLGDINLNSNIDDEGVQNIEILKFIRHPEYNPPSRYNDIALVQLKKKVSFTPSVYPICLNTKDDAHHSVFAVGWGKSSGKPDIVQMKILLEIYPHKKCSTYFEPFDRSLRKGISNETQICAGSQKLITYLCRVRNDDSGGPLVDLSETYCMYNLIGVTSIGDACILERRPRVYSRVTHYLDWIEKTVWP